ncbi:hypothetical protein EDB83DRAFT_2320047 [Lactarius deliciosus]|nr:hypothetical protein EDB83DRAFT_2320047 [Lactarius deliciosus]
MYMAAQSKGEGKGPVVMGCLVPLPARTGVRGSCAPFSRERWHEEGMCRGDAERRALVHPTSVQMEREGLGVASPFPRVQIGSAKGEGEAGVCVRRGRRWSTQGKGVSACIPCFDEEKEGGGGEREEREEREEKGSVAEAQCACHNWVDRTSYLLRATNFLSPPPIPVAHLRRSPFAKEDDPRPHPLHHAPRGWDAHEGTCHRLLPLSPVPPFPFAWKECTQGHAAASPCRPRPSPSPLAVSPRTERGTRARRPSPSPFDRTAVYMRERGTRGYATLAPPLPFMRKGVHEGTPPRTCGKGHEEHPVTTGPFPSSFDCAAVYVRERGVQGLVTPGPTFPIHAEGAHTRGTLPRYLPTTPPCTHRKGARMGKQPPAHPSHSRGRGTHEGHKYAWTAACEGKLPHPVVPHLHGKGHTRPLASLCVTQQGWRGLRVPAFTAPTPCFHAPLYDLDKKK